MKSLNPQSYGKFKFGQLRIINTIKKVVIHSLIRINLCVFFSTIFSILKCICHKILLFAAINDKILATNMFYLDLL